MDTNTSTTGEELKVKPKKKQTKQEKGPKFSICIEDESHSWETNTITTEEIAELGGWDPSIGVLEVNLKDGTDRTLEPGEVVELKPGKGFEKKVCWKRGDAFLQRIKEEIDLLKKRFEDVEYNPDGHWVRIGSFTIPTPGWSSGVTPVAFQIPTSHPGTPPSGFYVPSGTRFNDEIPQNYKEPAPNQPPFNGNWGVFSWAPEDGQWNPGAGVKSGTNLTDWVRGFAKRFQEGG